MIDFFRTQNNLLQLKTEIPSNDKSDDNLLRGELLDELAAALEKLDERERYYYSPLLQRKDIGCDSGAHGYLVFICKGIT